MKLIVTHVDCNCLETEVPEEEVNTRTINDSYVIGVDPSGSFVVGASGLTENLHHLNSKNFDLTSGKFKIISKFIFQFLAFRENC